MWRAHLRADRGDQAKEATPQGATQEDTMYATAHLDLVRTAVAERLEGTGTLEPVRIPAAPARITTWGPRASSRLAPVATPRVVELPRPRDLAPVRALVLLDA
jgi:hypothetical protein